VAVNKRKILESAQKHLQKGALDKALEDYQTLLKAEPKDSNTRLKVGDLHLKMGRVQDAIDAYLRVAQQFTNEGFDAKAVALYKQIAKLDDKRFEVHGQLGELYQRMGLTSEAMKALQTAADGAYRAGDKTTALGLLRRMAALDPTNTTSRLKVADLLRAEGKTDDAISEYGEVARELERQNAGEERLRVLERQLELAPDRLETLRAVAEAATACGAHERACSAAQALVSAAPDDVDLLELLGRTLEAAGRAEDAATRFRQLAERLRARGDEDRARALIQRYGSAVGTFGSDDSAPPVLEGDVSDLELDPEIDASLGLVEVDADDGSPARETTDPEPSDSSDGTIDLGPLDPEFESDVSATSARASEPPADADLEQLLAEASVFSRYGKHDRAVETLRAALRVEPGNPNTLEKLGLSLLALGNKAHAASSLQRAGAAFAEAGDAAATVRVRDALKPLDPRAAVALAVPAPAAPAPSDEIDIDIDVDTAEDAPSAKPEPETIEANDADLAGIEFELSDDPEPPQAEATPAQTTSPAEQLEAHGEVSFDTGVEEAEAPADEAPAKTNTLADLEEAEFYAAQGLNDEARGVLERVLAQDPANARAQAQLAALSLPVAAQEPEPTAVVSEAAELNVGDPAAAPPPPTPEVVADAAAEELELSVEEPEPAQSAAPLDVADVTTPDLGYVDEPEAPAVAPQTDDAFDLAAELSGALDGGSAHAAGGTEREGFQEVFAAFKAGVKREVGEGDTEAHYDLGIAYKEMGLFEDAIGEFRIALGDPTRKLSCLHLMGACALELGRGADAEAHLSQALAAGPLPAQQEAALRIDLGRAYRALGDVVRARAAYKAAQTLDPSFEGIDALLAELPAPGSEAPSRASGEGFESFDDLLGDDAVATAKTATPAPSYESFDDMLGEREADAPASPEPAPAAPEEMPAPLEQPEPAIAPAAVSPAREPEPEPETPASTRDASRPAPPPPAAPAAPGRRKKKISFV
jgi:tetratricopeptide (TPR) repeat protein